MGEEAKKPVEEKKMEGKKPEEGEESGKKSEEKKPENPPEKSGDPKEVVEEEKKKPQEIVLKIYMHCEGCAKKVRRCLKGFEGVEDVMTDCKSGKVIVKGDKADPLKVLERLQRKSNRQVELLSPIPEPKPAEEPEKKAVEKPKAEEKKEEAVTVVLRVHMHCEACAMEIQKRIMRMKGVESVEPEYKASQVIVKGIFTPATLVEYIYRKTGKHAAVVKQDPPPEMSPEKDKDKETKDKPSKEDKKAKAEEKKPKEEKNKKDQLDKAKEPKDSGGGGEAKPAVESGGDAAAAEETEKVVETKRNEYYYHYSPPRYPMDNVYYYAQPPQIFSDENPNACTLM
ncbi:PREDICTED: heavy metal-associated isoprenylated plant protein 3-like [Tarenaya hassleriana]|uniref:heavy metal-associated isoprenylated plant protein 3-like n=1 Tax=Tarenaya hassleriana TaxID=28532 RepID=UPI00053C4C7B|nr:PREDICTED: heavy metal-associated isoprenylated plant protein 3-like [Tarenaya hassleriana]